ncbi:Rossmann-fold NAD(P)-binding domain-containing protein [Arthrobacter antibioticus]|uniref:hypothetical protein n=1 Tax=Arthrobacter sp. H35-MC1 TaxID=3046203 RepID=UPI0024BA3E22|nr:hypothetical protein [Arthrobacter sp. H35-MC1]MDJ0318629.1 hypothetical protein [Arthrobacter sp. H35-MC1]
MAVKYWGARSEIFTSRFDPSLNMQIADLAAPGGPLDSDDCPKWWDEKAPTIILSIRRYDLNDQLGVREARILERASPAVILRCSPLDRSIPIYREWSSYGGLLATSFDPTGVAWLALDDLVAAMTKMSSAIENRAGKAYDITGPRKFSMNEMADIFANQLGSSVSAEYVSPEEMMKYLVQNGVDKEFARWTVELQAATSDTRLPDSSTTLERILDRPLTNPFDSVNI